MSVKNREKRIENLQRSNEESHRLIVDSLRQALYTMLKTRDIDSIKVVDLVKAAGVSRGGFYRNFYLVMVEYFTRRYTELAKKKLGTDILDTQLAYSIRFYCMGSVGMTQEWVLTDNITSAETVVQMMFNSMPENLRKILF